MLQPLAVHQQPPSQWDKTTRWIKAKAGYGPDQELAEQVYRRAQQQYQQAADMKEDTRRDAFEQAGKLFQQAAARWPDSRLEEECLFLAGESYFFADKYPKSEDLFAQLIRSYPHSSYMDAVDRRRFAIAQYWLDHAEADPDLPTTPNLTDRDLPMFDKFGHGIRVLERIRLDDPTGQLADDATMLAAQAYLRKQNFARADELLNDLRQSFPDSPHQFAAYLDGLKCKMMLYQGAAYHVTPLEEAENLVVQIQRQFPVEAREHHDFLLQVAKDVRMNKALREWQRAQYFDRRQQYGAARQYYDRISQTYTDTSLAEQAEKRLVEIGELPNHPPQYLPWLVEMLPESKPATPLLATDPFAPKNR
jgi:outer membrane protein assembly factor BamD (BamD/ComL family)